MSKSRSRRLDLVIQNFCQSGNLKKKKLKRNGWNAIEINEAQKRQPPGKTLGRETSFLDNAREQGRDRPSAGQNKKNN